MKKLIFATCLLAASPLLFVGCAKNSNKDMAKSIEDNSTAVVYSVESMDNLYLNDLSNNSKTSSMAKTSASKTNSSTSYAAIKTTTETNQEDLQIDSNSLGDAQTYSTELVEKRAKIMLLCSKLRKGEISLSKEDKQNLNEYLGLLKSTSKHLNSTKGSISNDFASIEGNSATSATKIAMREKLAIRQAKLQTSIFAMDQIISILEGKNNNQNTVKNQSATKSQATTTASTTKNNNQGTTKTSQTQNSNKIEKNNTPARNTTFVRDAKTQKPVAVQNKNNNSVTTIPTNQKTNSNKKTTTNKAKTQNTNKTTSKTSTNITATKSNTSSTDNNAVSILVQPVKTNQTTPTETTKKNVTNQTNYVVRPSATYQNANNGYANITSNNTKRLVAPGPLTEGLPLPMEKLTYPQSNTLSA